jgi:hypothetical protein
MSGPGDIDGQVSGDEAAWRDLVARFDSPTDQSTDPPWPSSEDVAWPAASGTDPADADPAGSDLLSGDAPSADGSAADSGAADFVNQDSAGDPVITRDPLSGIPGTFLPADRTRIVRYTRNPRDYTPSDEDEQDEPYVAAPLPPPAKLDPIAKAAWVGVVGGPGYLLVVSLFLHMAVSATAAFIAVAAFVGGFATLIVKLGDRSSRDDDDDGAVL